MTPFRLAKWYCDVLSDDGTLLILTLGELRLASMRRARLAMELHRADGNVTRDAASLGGFRETDAGCTFDGGGVGPAGLAWRAAASSGAVRLMPRFPAATPRDPLLQIERGALRWRVEVPDADADVELASAGGRVRLAGRAYCDRVQLDALPWRVGFQRLTWGHAVFAVGATWWLELVTRQGTIATTWRDGAFAEGCAPPLLRPARALVDRRVAQSPVLRVPPLGSVARWLAGDPYQQRWLARAGADQTGWAVHESVRWRQARA
jgi:hypothetical protein